MFFRLWVEWFYNVAFLYNCNYIFFCLCTNVLHLLIFELQKQSNLIHFEKFYVCLYYFLFFLKFYQKPLSMLKIESFFFCKTCSFRRQFFSYVPTRRYMPQLRKRRRNVYRYKYIMCIYWTYLHFHTKIQ